VPSSGDLTAPAIFAFIPKREPIRRLEHTPPAQFLQAPGLAFPGTRNRPETSVSAFHASIDLA
jgi:hypothetical protein